MASLTETAYYTRKIIVVFLVSIIGFLVLKSSFTTARNIWRKFRPPPPPPPNMAFGKLPTLKFPEKPIPPEISIKLETIEGDFPSLPTVGKVYFMPQKSAGFLDLTRAKQKAKAMGFNQEPEAITDVLYRWEKKTDPPTSLQMNTNTGNFLIHYQYSEDQSLLESKNLPNQKQAAAEAKNYLSRRGLLPEEIANGTSQAIYFRFLPPDLIPAVSLSEANFIRLNLFRENLDELKILPPNPKETPISFLFSGSRKTSKRIVEVKYIYHQIDREISATYPLKPVEKAWQELLDGQAYLANIKKDFKGVILIRQISLAYFDSEEKQNFLQPIYVFEGDQDFMAFVPAIDPQWQE